MRQGLRVLAVIPARGGSRGIPRKNLREIAGRTLVGHAVAVALALPWIDYTVVSTDDEEIAAEGRRHGASVPFLRPVELATDDAGAAETWRHAWLSSEATAGETFDVSLLLEPTSPLRTIEDITLTFDTLVAGGHACAATVSRTPAHYTPHKSLTVGPDGLLGFFTEGGAAFAIRQRVPPLFHRNGICYAATRENVVERGQVIGDDTAAVVVDRPVVNIDDPFDLELATWLMEKEEARP